MSMLDWRYYPKIARIARMAGADVGRGSETLMTYSRGDLFRAARHLSGSKEGRPARALVVTGFYIPKAAQPAAETDGPLGALEVCMALRAIGGDAWLVSDECCAPVIRPSALGFLPDDHVLIAPNANPKGGFDAWLNGVIDLAKTELRTDPAADYRADNTQYYGDDKTTAIFARHNPLRQNTRNKPKDNPGYNSHSFPLCMVFVIKSTTRTRIAQDERKEICDRHHRLDYPAYGPDIHL